MSKRAVRRRLPWGEARRRSAILLPVLVLLAVGAPGADAEPWKIGVAGSWGTGYIGFFARHGMPRERLLDTQVADLDVLRQYQAVIVSGGINGWDAASRAVEEYVREGGYAILECAAYPSAEALPGTRIQPQGAPNFVIEAAGHPALPGIPQGKTYAHNGYSAAAIVAEGGNATVLARFTEEGASTKVQGRFVQGGKSVPAIIHVSLGKGHLIYCGPWIGYGLAFGRDYQDLVFALMRFFTKGNVEPRLTLAGPENLFITRSWGRPIPEEPPPAAGQVLLPDGYTVVEALAGGFEEYDVVGSVAGEADLLLDYLDAARYYAVHLAADGRLRVTTGGEDGEQELASAASQTTGQLMVARRRGSVRVLLDGRRVLETADRGQWGGTVAGRGLAEPTVQPIGEIRFTDDFMRESGQAGEWQPVSGPWQVISTEGSPKTGANPFSYGIETEEAALATTGEWFWDDYEAQVSARWTQNAAGLVFGYRDPQNYSLLEADLAQKMVHLVKVSDGQRTVLESAAADLRPWQWYRLGVRASRQLVVGSLDGRQLLEATDAEAGPGPVGLHVRGAKAAFDDVEVSDWRALPALRSQEPGLWRPIAGEAERLKDGGLGVRGVVHGPEQWGDVTVTAEVHLGKARRAGVKVREQDGAACAAVLALGPGGLVLKLVAIRNGEETAALGSVPLKGLSAEAGHRLLVRAVRDRISCSVDDEPALVRAVSMPRSGWLGLYGDGTAAAKFRSIDIRPAESDLRDADPPTPAYAGVVDVMTWAGPAFSWLPDPGDLSLFWHEGQAPGNLRLKMGVHKGEATAAVAEVVLAPRDGSPGDRTVARFRHEWGTPEVAVSVERGGKSLAQATYTGDVAEGGFLTEVERAAGTLALRVNGVPTLTHNDATGAVSGPRVGVRLTGTTLCYDDLALQTAGVRDYAFTRAPTDWLVQMGTWEVTSRWTCAPGWTWLSGMAPEHAAVQSKWQVEGDVLVDAYVGAKMMNTPSGRKEVLQDLRLGICGRPGYLNAGYFFLIGARGGNWTALQRDGLIVAERSDFQIPQGSVHNDWLRLGVEKQGNTVSLLCHGQPVLSYTDPDPLPGGTVSAGTYNNGVMIPRVTVYGEIKG